MVSFQSVISVRKTISGLKSVIVNPYWNFDESSSISIKNIAANSKGHHLP